MTAALAPSARLHQALRSLEGLSVGDVFGDRFFTSPHTVERLIELRALPAGPWPITDDTVMAISIVDVLSDVGLEALWTLAAREPLENMSRERLSEQRHLGEP